MGCMVLTACSQEQVSITIYVHEGDLNGTLLSDVQVTGQDAAGSSFTGTTDSDGALTVSRQPGTWMFKFEKDGYDTLNLNYDDRDPGSGSLPYKNCSITKRICLCSRSDSD